MDFPNYQVQAVVPSLIETQAVVDPLQTHIVCLEVNATALSFAALQATGWEALAANRI